MCTLLFLPSIACKHIVRIGRYGFATLDFSERLKKTKLQVVACCFISVIHGFSYLCNTECSPVNRVLVGNKRSIRANC